MQYLKTIALRDGRACVLRSATEDDAQAALENFILTHEQTDYLLSYPDELAMTVEQGGQFLRKKHESEDEVELLAEVDGKVVGLAGIDRVGSQRKLRHRAEFGISIDRACWGFGIGRALLRACIECARAAGYAQLELAVVADNARAVALYTREGFVEYGRNPRGFRSDRTGWQPLALMRMELTE